MMNITVFGASGAIGTQFIALAKERGHAIRAVYRTMPPVSPSGQVEILVNPDIFNPDFVTQAIRGADVVVTALGPNFAKHHNILLFFAGEVAVTSSTTASYWLRALVAIAPVPFPKERVACVQVSARAVYHALADTCPGL